MKKILAFLLSFFLAVPLSFGATLEADWMEYANDTAAQTAYVSNASATALIPTMTSNTDPSGACTASDDTYYVNYPRWKAVDKDTGTYYWSYGSGPWWFAYQFASTPSVVTSYTVTSTTAEGPKDFTLQGSNDGSSWTTLDTQTGITSWGTPGTKTFTFSNSTTYSYYKLNVTATNQYQNLFVSFNEFDVKAAAALTASSESTIKTQGSYSLKGVATTGALNKTLTRTLSTTQNLTGVKNLKFDIRSSRTGSNIKIGIHDSGGTTTEITPNIISANTFQTVNWSLAAVSDANKDAIDSIIITITNADSANTFYIDNFEIAQAIDVFGMVG